MSISDLGQVIFGDLDTRLPGFSRRTCCLFSLIIWFVVLQWSYRTTQNLCHGSFFEKSKLSLQKWLILLHWMIREYSTTSLCRRRQLLEGLFDIYMTKSGLDKF